MDSFFYFFSFIFSFRDKNNAYYERVEKFTINKGGNKMDFRQHY